jgi:hypothetical protein
MCDACVYMCVMHVCAVHVCVCACVFVCGLSSFSVVLAKASTYQASVLPLRYISSPLALLVKPPGFNQELHPDNIFKL